MNHVLRLLLFIVLLSSYASLTADNSEYAACAMNNGSHDICPITDDKLDTSLDRVPERKATWLSLLKSSPAERRPGLAYILMYMPLADLKVLPVDTVEANVALAYQARTEVPWGATLPEDIFLDDVLPYASLTEPRQSMRAEFHNHYLPLIKNYQSPVEAALALNDVLFRDYKVTFNKHRLRNIQSSKENITQGMATCTGLSIMLVEASRAVGIPARLAGIESWPKRGGNHTWVEVWDKGWHFMAAGDNNPKGADHAWFKGLAAKAIDGSKHHGIYAASYRWTGQYFPLAWDKDWDKVSNVNAIEITGHYQHYAFPGPGH